MTGLANLTPNHREGELELGRLQGALGRQGGDFADLMERPGGGPQRWAHAHPKQVRFDTLCSGS